MSGDLISRKAALKEICLDCHKPLPQYPEHGCPDPCYVYGGVSNLPAVDAVEVVHGFYAGDVCFYGYAPENNSLVLAEIVKILNDERGVAEIKVLKVFEDASGNGLFNYLYKTGNTMNASFKYLRNITPEREENNG